LRESNKKLAKIKELTNIIFVFIKIPTMTTTTRVPDAPDMILKELSCLDVTKVDISKISFDKLHRAIEWVFYV